MNKEFFKAIKALEDEKGVSSEYMFEKIRAAIVSALRSDYENREDVVMVDINPEAMTMRVYARILVVDEDERTSDVAEMSLEQARRYDPNAQIGSYVEIERDPKAFGRIVAQTAKSVIRQGIREAEKALSNQEIKDKEGEIVTARVNLVYPDTGDAQIEIGKAFGMLLKSEQIPGETLAAGQLIKVYVAAPKGENNAYSHISRKHAHFVERLFESEVPEIADGIVLIKSISREAGSRTKIAVCSTDEKVDAVGACIGSRGQRVGNIVDILQGEKIDIVEYDENPEKYIAAALAPAEVVSVSVMQDSGAKSCRAIVPDNQLSLAIGNKGQNVRLAARLTGWKIDIKPASQAE